ncbi:MAG: putative baseplate assembly protein, partial [Chloroflexi bacterium]
TAGQPGLPAGSNLWWIRCRLLQSSYERAPMLEQVLTSTVRAVQALTTRDEVLGGSTGLPGQHFQLADTPVVALDQPLQLTGADGRRVRVSSVQVEVDEGAGGGFLAWQEVQDFYGSGPDDPHFVVNRTAGVVLFGDGRTGRIPVANPQNANANVVARIYRSGGGTGGNVGAGMVTQLQTTVQSVDSVVNLRPAQGGADEETLDHAKLRAPQELKNKGRAVTAEDFESLAAETPGALVRRARALPLTNPRFPGVELPGVVTVIVVPESDRPNPTPNQTTLSLVCGYLNEHRLLTSEVYVTPPSYRLVRIQVRVVVDPTGDLGEVGRLVADGLTAYFHPLTGGEQCQGWEFGGTIYYSQVYRRIVDVPQVSRIQENQLTIWLDGVAQLPCRDVALNPGELLYSTGHEVLVDYGAQA